MYVILQAYYIIKFGIYKSDLPCRYIVDMTFPTTKSVQKGIPCNSSLPSRILSDFAPYIGNSGARNLP